MENLSASVEAEFTLFRPKFHGMKRRDAKRFRSGLASLGKVRLPMSRQTVEAYIQNVSMTGICLTLPAAPEVGSDIQFLFRTTAQGQPLELPARIVYVNSEADEMFRIGCEFHTPLEPDLLETLLG